jgi:predicted transcriptional regulator
MNPKAAIEKLLKSPGATETTIAQRVGVSQSTINRIRHGLHDPRMSVAAELVRLAKSARVK